jgi:hypothetical protein
MIPMRRLTTALLVALLLALGLLTATAAPAAAIPTETGCPSSSQVLSVAELIPLGYRAPAEIDAPANGGNGNGLVCGLPLPEAYRQARCGPNCPVPVIYLFRDDNLPAQQ